MLILNPFVFRNSSFLRQYNSKFYCTHDCCHSKYAIAYKEGWQKQSKSSLVITCSENWHSEDEIENTAYARTLEVTYFAEKHAVSLKHVSQNKNK